MQGSEDSDHTHDFLDVAALGRGEKNSEHGIVWNCTLFYNIAGYWMLLYNIVYYCIFSHGIIYYYMVLYCTVYYDILLWRQRLCCYLHLYRYDVFLNYSNKMDINLKFNRFLCGALRIFYQSVLIAGPKPAVCITTTSVTFLLGIIAYFVFFWYAPRGQRTLLEDIEVNNKESKI